MSGLPESQMSEVAQSADQSIGTESREKETWIDVKDWEGIYQISNNGRLKSFKKHDGGYILSLKNQYGWYFSVVLCKKGMKSQSIKIHQLVAQYFVPNPLNRNEINHKDGNKQHNYYKNLEWVTTKQNCHHAIKNGLADFKTMNYHNQVVRPKTVIQFDLDGNYISEFINCIEAGKSTGVCSRNIHQVASKTEYGPGLTRKQAGGFIWRFKDD